MRVVKILIGIPTSGKSTWAKKQSLPIISCDDIREEFKTNYNPELEKLVWNCFYKRINKMRESFVIDNTNCRINFINNIKRNIKKDFKIEYIWFEIPLWKAFYRNIIRYIKTGKYTPFSVIIEFKINYDKLKQESKIFKNE